MTGRGHGVETAACRGLYLAPVTLIWKPAYLERPGCPGWIPSVPAGGWYLWAGSRTSAGLKQQYPWRERPKFTLAKVR